jgi:hypothetical protein
MTDEVQGKSRGVRELTEALNRQPFIAEENLALDLDFRKRLRPNSPSCTSSHSVILA